MQKKHANPTEKANELIKGFANRSATANIPAESLQHLEKQKEQMEQVEREA